MQISTEIIIVCRAHVYTQNRRKEKRGRRSAKILRDVDQRVGFPRYDEIVKRFMKAFMKGFTSHGPNWGPESFASATHVQPRRRTPLPPRSLAGSYAPLVLFLPLFIFPSSRVFAQRAEFSLSILESASFFIIIISIVDTSFLARSRLSRRFFSSFFFFALLFSSGVFHCRYFCPMKFFTTLFDETCLGFTFARTPRNVDVIKENKRNFSIYDQFYQSRAFFNCHSYDCRRRRRRTRGVDVRFRVNWISSAFLFSN